MWYTRYGEKKPATTPSFSDNSNADAAPPPPKRYILTKKVEYFIETCIFGGPFLGIFISNRPTTNLSAIEKVLVYFGVVAIFYGIWVCVLMLLNDYREKPFLWLTREKFKAFSKKHLKYIYGALVMIAFLAILQVFFRYESATIGSNNTLVKIDRVTGKVWVFSAGEWQESQKPTPIAETPKSDIGNPVRGNYMRTPLEIFRAENPDVADISDDVITDYLYETESSGVRSRNEFRRWFNPPSTFDYVKEGVQLNIGETMSRMGNIIEVMASENRVMNIVEFRKKYPELDDVTDIVVAEFLHEKYYSNMPEDEFKKKFLLIR